MKIVFKQAINHKSRCWNMGNYHALGSNFTNRSVLGPRKTLSVSWSAQVYQSHAGYPLSILKARP
jgi:hypothetical protein